MGATTGGERASSLTLEPGTGTVLVDGARVKLPPKGFALLAELADQPGDALSPEELIARLWPDTPGMTSQDLYWVVWQVRKLIGDDKRKTKLLGNRRGFGYLIDLDPSAVHIGSEAPGPWLDAADGSERPIPLSDISPAPESSQPTGDLTDVVKESRFRVNALVRGAAIGMLLIAVAWAAGYAASRWASNPTSPPRVAELPAHESASPSESKDREKSKAGNRPRPKPKPKGNKGREREGSRTGGSNVAAAGPPPQTGPVSETDIGSTTEDADSSGDGTRKQPQQPELPPAPTSYLYLLQNERTADYFVTTDGGVASEYEGRGYHGRAIARVYTYAEEGTKAISTNHGTAYIFSSSAPKTEPASQTAALYYATNGDGDFLYTTSQAEAGQAGWDSSVIGYVRTVS